MRIVAHSISSHEQINNTGSAVLSYFRFSAFRKDPFFLDYLLLRAIVGNTFRIKILLILCNQFVLCMDCQFMK